MPIRKQHNKLLSEPSSFTIFIIITCFFLSGFAALIYQTAWLRQFSIIFGTSELAVATILAAYMAGLGIGANIAGRFINHIKNPVMLYGFLEGGIALSALAVPYLLDFSRFLFILFLGGQPEPPASTGLGQTVFYLISTFIIIAIPTTFMGATLPLLSKNLITKDKQVGPRIAYLYAFNSFGAVLGTVITAFVLLPKYGLSGSILIAVFCNFLIFVIIALFVKNIAAKKSNAAPVTANRSRIDIILPIIFFSGATSFLYEILWTRMLSHLLGGTIYAFAVMLGSFLAGIALGSALASQFTKNQNSSRLYFAGAQIAIALLSLLVYNWMSIAIPEQNDFQTLAIFAATIIFPSTLFIGSTFPLAVRIMSKGADDVGLITARVYTWNTFGAILGALATGYFIIASLGFEGAIKLGISLNLLMAMAVCINPARKLRLMGGFAGVLFAVTLFALTPARPAAIINSSPLGAEDTGEEVFYAVGRSATVLVKRDEGSYIIKTNGLPEAVVLPKGSPPIRQNQKWLMALPNLARPNAENALVIGFGGGVALENIPANIQHTDVIELEDQVIIANEYIGDKRANNPLENPTVNIIINDARNALSLTNKIYDIIVSQPSHPWTAGASHLYTREFITLSKRHLKKDGVFLQWINASFINEPLLKSIAATLKSEFSYVRLYEPEPLVLMFLASDSPLEIEKNLQKDNDYLLRHTEQFSKVGIRTIEDLLAALSMNNASLTKFIEGANINTDNKNHLATHSHADGKGLTFKELYRITKDYHPLLKPDHWIYNPENDHINLSYLAERQIAVGMSKKALDLAKTVKNSSTVLTMMGIGLQYHGKVEDSQKAYYKSIQIDQNNDQTTYRYIRPYLAKLARNSAPPEITQTASLITSPSANAVIQGWRFGISRNWKELENLDKILAQTKPTDSWLPQATKIRLDWRFFQNSTRQKVELGREIMAIADKTILFYPTAELFMQRATGALIADDKMAFVETISAMLNIINQKITHAKSGQYAFSSSEKTKLLNRFTGIKAHFETISLDKGIGEDVYKNIENILNKLSSIQIL